MPQDALLATLAGTDGRIKYVSLERAEAQGLVEFLKWCAAAFANIRLIPPGTGRDG
jgi:hypothetical protein